MSTSQWKRFGIVDPYFAVLTAQKFHGHLSGSARSEFFRTGEEHIARVFLKIGEFTPERVLDFGCGVGRLLRPLATRSKQVVGIDISPGMLAEARKNCADLTNVTISELVDAADRFDLIHSYIVFQHIRPARGIRIATKLLESLKQGGSLRCTLHSGVKSHSCRGSSRR
jgi:2-polyprenyl-3-methyl-5-hydroxy-6-metoxy-1,4-benzoquinol methylase